MIELRLYVAGNAPNSVEARSNLDAILSDCERDSYDLEVVDFMREPQRALGDGVIVTPTLVKLNPPPVQKVIGTLRDRQTVARALGFGAVGGE